MILILDQKLDEKQEQKVLEDLGDLGYSGQLVRSSHHSMVILKEDVRSQSPLKFSNIEGVEKVVRLEEGFPLVSDVHERVVTIQSSFGEGEKTYIGQGQIPLVMAGPCSVESREQILEIAKQVKASGARVLRAGAFKPRTSPYEFQGLRKEGLEYLKEAGRITALPVITEVMSTDMVSLVSEYADILQIGTRNMYNYELLREVGKQRLPVLLKRGMSATIDEFLFAAEYILKEGNENVILCERGIRTFETRLRNTLDLSAVPLIKSLSGLPVVVDPSHATGLRKLVKPMSRAAIACGADGLLLETHTTPEKSISDAKQAISPEELASIVDDVYSIAFALGGAKDGNLANNMVGSTVASSQSARSS